VVHCVTLFCAPFFLQGLRDSLSRSFSIGEGFQPIIVSVGRMCCWGGCCRLLSKSNFETEASKMNLILHVECVAGRTASHGVRTGP
jgi:hypothetical protein